MGKLTDFGSGWSVNDHVLTTKAKLKLSDGLKATVEHRSAAEGKAQAVALTLAGKKWEVAHDFGKKDTRLKYKTKLGGGEVTLKQVVPNNKWALVPNPEVTVSRGGWLGEHSKLQASYNFLDRVGTLEETIYADDKKHKAWVKLHSQKGPSAGLRSKRLAGPLLHSLAAQYSQRGGWELTAKSKFKDDSGIFKVKTTYEAASEMLKIAAKHTPAAPKEGAAKASLTLGMAVPVHKPQDPRVHFGIKWDL